MVTLYYVIGIRGGNMNKKTYKELYDAQLIDIEVVKTDSKDSIDPERVCEKIGADSWTVYEAIPDISELNIFIKAREVKHLKTIKSCVVFFTVITLLNILMTIFLFYKL